jgi:hypothetical protein
MLVGRSPEGSSEGLQEEVEMAMATPEGLAPLLAQAAGNWPPWLADAMAHLALRCATPRRRARPALDSQVLPELEVMLQEAEQAATREGRYDAVGGWHAWKLHAAGDAHAKELEPTRLCVVCLDREATHAFIPCGHQCVCGADGEAVMRQPAKSCPVCRVRSECLVHIY